MSGYINPGPTNLVMQFVLALVVSLPLTLAVEPGLFLALSMTNRKTLHSPSLRHNLLLVVLVNLATNPTAMLLYWTLLICSPLSRFCISMGIEALVVGAEFFLFRRFGQGIQHPLLLSVVLNVFSYVIGLLVV